MKEDTTIKIPITMALVIWKALNNVNAKEADLIAASLIGQGVEFLGSPEETIDFYREYLITEGVIEVEPETKH